MIEANFGRENIFYIFRIVSQFKINDTHRFVLKFLKLNSNYEIFKKLSLYSFRNYKGSRISYMKEEREFFNDLQYLEHIALVEQRINQIF